MDLAKILKVFDDKKYSVFAQENKNNFINAKPFKHAVFDEFLPYDIAREVAKCYPKAGSSNKNWKYHKNSNVERYLLEDTTDFEPELAAFSASLCSRSFLLFLETLTGIKALLADPYFMGGGAMATGTNGFLNVHVDYNYNQKIQGWRRLNFLLYLTEEWEKEYKGNLQLFSYDGSSLVKEVTPFFNRAVVFETTSTSFHGQPEPLACPTDIYRNVFSAFYYTSEISEQSHPFPHYTLYRDNKTIQRASMESSPYAELITEQYLDVEKALDQKQ